MYNANSHGCFFLKQDSLIRLLRVLLTACMLCSGAAFADGLSITAPAAGSQHADMVSVVVDAPAHANSRAQKINLKVDDQFYKSQPYSSGKSQYQYSLNSGAFKNGWHKLTVITIDNGRIVSSADQWVEFQNNKLDLDTPTSGTQISGTYTATGMVRVNADKVNIKFDQNNEFVYSNPLPVNKRDAQSFSIKIDSTRLSDGNHTMIVRAVTNSGKDLKTISIPFSVNNGNSTDETTFDSTIIPLPQNAAYAGVYTLDTDLDGPYNWQSRLSAIRNFEQKVYQNSTDKLAMDRQFYSWDNLLNPEGRLNPYIKATSDLGRIPIISIYTLNNNKSEVACPDGSGRKIWACIAAGEMDGTLATMAGQIRDSGIPKMGFIFVLEPENEIRCHNKRKSNPNHLCVPDNKGFDMGSSADYRAAWRRVVSVFDNEGVMNVDFIWNMQAALFDPETQAKREFESPESMYPGNDVIDWIGTDAYNTAFDRWKTLETLVTPTVEWAEKHAPNKPIMLPEFGVAEDPTASDHFRRANWFNEASRWVRTQKKIKAVVYFNRTEEFNSIDTHRNWRVDSLRGSEGWPNYSFREQALPNSLKAFQDFVQNPYFLNNNSMVQ